MLDAVKLGVARRLVEAAGADSLEAQRDLVQAGG